MRDLDAMHLEQVACLRFQAIPPYSFERTIRKYTKYGTTWYFMTPFEIYRHETLWTGFPFQDEPIGLKIEAKGSISKPRVSVEVFARRKLKTSRLKDVSKIIKNSLGLEEDLSPFYALAHRDPILRQAKKDLYGMRITPLPDLLSALILAITLQRASYGRTERMLHLLYLCYGQKVRFDNQRVIVCPRAQTLAEVSELELREECKLGYRARYLKAAAEAVANQELPDLRELGNLSIEQARDVVMRVKGIGEYAAEVILPHPSFPIDSWSAKIFQQLFCVEPSERAGGIISAIKTYAKREFGEWQRYVYEYIVNDICNIAKLLGLQINDSKV